MSYLEITLLALALSADAFSVGAAVGSRHGAPRQVLRLSFHFGLFQALMPLLGVLAGAVLLRRVEAFAHWVSFGMLAAIGVRMIAGSLGREKTVTALDPTRGLTLIGLSLAVSIDALAAGVPLAAERTPLAPALAIIGVVSAAATALGMSLAGRIEALLGRRCELLAGLVLIGLGARILAQHLWA